MSEYTINKDVPMPQRAANKAKYPFDKMEVGDSFDVCETECYKVRNPASVYGKKHNMTFMVRKTPTGGTCWRVK